VHHKNVGSRGEAMREDIAIIMFLISLPGGASAAQLPLKDGRYVAPTVACDDAPMSVTTRIYRGLPAYSPQFGSCKTVLRKIGANVFSATSRCGQDKPPEEKYTVLGPTKYSLKNINGRFVYRWCGKN
jgi:hypothetical protein